MWGAKYESEEYAKEHDHGNSEWSFCIYLNEGQGFPPLIVHDKKIYPKRGDVLVINGETYHWSSKNRTDEPRCTFIAHYTDESIRDFMWYNKLFIEK